MTDIELEKALFPIPGGIYSLRRTKHSDTHKLKTEEKGLIRDSSPTGLFP